MAGIWFNVCISSSDIKQAAQYSFAGALFASLVVAGALVGLPMPIDRVDLFLVVLPPLVLCLVWVVVGLFAGLLYAGLLLIEKIHGKYHDNH